MIEHARAEAPFEACGLLAGRGGRVEKVYRMENIEKSPVVYRLNPREYLKVQREVDEQGLELLAIYHSHTHSPAFPSATDVEWAFWNEGYYLIVSLATNPPHIRAFRIVEDKITEVDLEVV